MGGLLFAVREVRRSAVRFGLLVGAVGILAFLIVFQQALLGSLVEQFVGAIRHQSAEVLVYGDTARRNLQGSVVAPTAVEAVADVAGVAEAGPLGLGTFTVEAAGGLADANVFGHRPGGPGSPTTVEEGRAVRAEGEAVASTGAGDGFAVGDTVRVAPDGQPLRIVGLARDTSLSVTPTLFVPYASYDAAVRTANPDAADVAPSAVAVRVADGADPAEVATAITSQVDGVEGLTRAAAVSETPGVAAVNQSFGIVLGLTYGAVALVVGFFFLILTVQKAPSLTLLRALGAPAAPLAWGVVAQVVAVVLGGLAVGVALTAAVLAAGTGGIGATVQAPAVATTGAVLLVLGVLASLVSVRRVLRLDPASATTGGRG